MNPFDVEFVSTPESEAMNRILLRVTRQLSEDEAKQWLVYLSKAWNEGFNACRDQMARQKIDPLHPIGRPDPYAEMLQEKTHSDKCYKCGRPYADHESRPDPAGWIYLCPKEQPDDH